MERCETLIPANVRSGLVFREIDAPRAWCGGEELAMTSSWAGAWRHVFDAPLAPETRCEVEVDGSRFDLPPMPPTPDPLPGPLHLRWTPGGGDEVRASVPRSGGEITLCRLEDDGVAPLPPGIRRQLSFFSRSRYAVERVGGGDFALNTTVGVWLEPEG